MQLEYMQISLSHISVLLRQPLSIKKSSAGTAHTCTIIKK
jgi:hypothetical protein